MADFKFQVIAPAINILLEDINIPDGFTLDDIKDIVMSEAGPIVLSKVKVSYFATGEPL